MSRQALNPYIRQLKRVGAIKKKGYCLWEAVVKENINNIDVAKRCKGRKKTSHLKRNRGHGFVYSISVPKSIRWWNDRHLRLDRYGIYYEDIDINKKGQRIHADGNIVWLSQNNIVVYDRNSYYNLSASTAKGDAVAYLIGLIKYFEELLKFSLRQDDGTYKFKVSRNHYALIRCDFAAYCNNNKHRIRVSDERGQWFIVDNSLNLNESETVHPKTARRDMDKVIAPFFNRIKRDPEILDKLIANQAYYSENMVSHVEAIKDLGNGVKKFNSKIDILIDYLIELRLNK